MASASASVSAGCCGCALRPRAVRTGGRRWMVKASAPTSVDDGARHHRVHALDERHDRHDRRDGDDVAEHGHERPQLVGPDGLQRDGDRLEDLVHAISIDGCDDGRRIAAATETESPVTGLRRHRRTRLSASLTSAPSASSRTEANGPVMTRSPAFSPDSDLEVALAGNADLDRHEDGAVVA